MVTSVEQFMGTADTVRLRTTPNCTRQISGNLEVLVLP
jgi:hypothetical protein